MKHVFVLVLLLAFAAAAVNDAAIVTSGGSVYTLLFDVPSESYVDNIVGQDDVTIRAYASASSDLSGKYISVVYKTGNLFIPVMAKGGDEMAPLGSVLGSGPYYATGDMTLNFLSSEAKFPARPYAVVSADSVIDAGDAFVSIPQANGWLSGSYAVNDVVPTYQPDTSVQVIVEGITGNKIGGGTYEVTSNKPNLVVGVCSDEFGLACSESNVTAKDVVNMLITGVTPAQARTTPAQRYVVVNGINARQFCVGQDLEVTVSPSATEVSKGDPVTFTVNAKNTGNVGTTSSVQVKVYDGAVELCELNLGTINAFSQKNSACVWDTSAASSTLHAITAKVDGGNGVQGSINECNEENDQAQTSVNVVKTYSMAMSVDGAPVPLPYSFPAVGRPYSVLVTVKDSDGAAVPGAMVRFVERNGLTLFSPVQTGAHVMKSTSTGEVLTNSSGQAVFVLIPTGNKFYDEVSGYATDVGEAYSLRAEILVGGELKKTYAFSVGDLTAGEPPASATISVVNQLSVEDWFTALSQVWSTVQKWLT
ncbi:MAG: hypothetical protein JW834_02540 [Candidatus Diapherotrites archaeon]|nr:hypothetical protein [Candidatus Diapherotrites archaeon]